MAAVQFENFFSTELSTAVAPGDTTIQITQDGLLSTLLTGGNWIYLNLIDATSWNNNAIPPATYEIVKATAITGTGPFTLTVTRAQDHTTAQSFSRCDICAFLLNAQSLYDISTTPGSGTVTLINTTLPITGGPISTTGTIGINTFGASGGAHARGAVPDPGASAGTTKFLREDATWQVPPGGGGAVTSVSTTDPALTISPTTGAVIVSANNFQGDAGTGGVHGVVPAPAAGDAAANKFLKANGTWATTPGGGGGTLQGQEFTSSGTFNVPSGVTSAWITMIGGGGAGGGSTAAATGGGGGGSGELVQFMPVLVTSSSAVTVTVPTAATGSSGSNGADGGDVSFGVYLARGGKGGTTAGASGAGGGTGGSASKGAGNPGTLGTSGGAEAPTHFGGGSGGGAGNTTGSAGSAGGGAGPYSGAAGGSSASSQAGGGGGASTIYGQGGAGANGGSTGSTATSTNYGAGGGGGGGNASNSAGGSGAPGYVLVQWVS